jgi:adenylate cyclase
MMKILKRYDIIVSVLLFLAAIPVQHLEWFALLEDQTTSLRHQLRMAYGDAKALAVSKDIVLVNTDETFFKAYKSFPLRRTDIAAIVTNLKELGAKVIAIDMLIDFPSSYNEDPALAKAMAEAGNTLLASQAEFRGGRFVKINRPTEMLHKASVSAYTNITANSSLLTTLSRLTVHPEIAREAEGWPFSVKAASMFLGVEPVLEGGMMRLGDLAVPLDHNSRLPIDFPPLPAGSRFLSQSVGISALEFLDISGLDDNEREELAAWVRGKIVVLGDTSEVSHDWFDTPVGMVYGVEIIADTISSVLKGGPLRAASPSAQVLLVLLVLAAMALPMALKNPMQRGMSALAVLVGVVGFGTLAYVRQGVVFPLSYVMLAAFLSYLLIEYRYYMLERNQKKQIAKTFGQYIPAELVEEMNRSGQQVSIGGESREMTVLFSDVRGFTTISEGLSPQDLSELMNAFLSPMTKVIHTRRGTIDKYMGDAIMAFWGAPLHDAEHARHAVQAALEMDRTMKELGESFTARGWKPLKIGIGLNTGTMAVGNMGSDFRLAYTVLGDAVNLGSRVESLTKQYGVGIMITEYTHRAVPGLVARELDLVRVKGKDVPVGILEPVGFEDELDAGAKERVARFSHALALYRRQDWAGARSIIAALAAEDPDRLIYSIYLDRITHFEAEPPGRDWDGVYTHQSK